MRGGPLFCRMQKIVRLRVQLYPKFFLTFILTVIVGLCIYFKDYIELCLCCCDILVGNIFSLASTSFQT